MATAAPITGAPSGAPISYDALSQFESVQADFSVLRAVMQAAMDATGPTQESGIDCTNLLVAAMMIGNQIGFAIDAAVERGFAERRPS